MGSLRTPSLKPPYPDERAESREERAESGSRKEKVESGKWKVESRKQKAESNVEHTEQREPNHSVTIIGESGKSCKSHRNQKSGTIT
jgi:hypothetical protein